MNVNGYQDKLFILPSGRHVTVDSFCKIYPYNLTPEEKEDLKIQLKAEDLLVKMSNSFSEYRFLKGIPKKIMVDYTTMWRQILSEKLTFTKAKKYLLHRSEQFNAKTNRRPNHTNLFFVGKTGAQVVFYEDGTKDHPSLTKEEREDLKLQVFIEKYLFKMTDGTETSIDFYRSIPRNTGVDYLSFWKEIADKKLSIEEARNELNEQWRHYNLTWRG